MKLGNEKLANSINQSFAAPDKGILFIASNSAQIADDPDVLYASLQHFKDDVKLFQNLMKTLPAGQEKVRILIYLYLALHTFYKINNMENECRVLRSAVISCMLLSNQSYKSLFLWANKILSDEKSVLAFLQGIRRATTLIFSEENFGESDVLHYLYADTFLVWQANKADPHLPLVQAMVLLSQDDPDFFNWMCSTPFAPVIRCQAAVFYKIAQDAKHPFYETAVNKIPFDWNSYSAAYCCNGLLYRNNIPNIDFTTAKSDPLSTYSKALFNCAKSFSMQLVFWKKNYYKDFEDVPHWKFLSQMDSLPSLPIKLDVAVSFTAIFLKLSVWDTPIANPVFCTILKHLLAMHEPAIDWMVAQFFIQKTSKTEPTPADISPLFAPLSTLFTSTFSVESRAPFLRVLNPDPFVKECLSSYKRSINKQQGEDFINDLDLTGFIPSIQKAFKLTRPEITAAQNLATLIKNKRNATGSNVRCFTLSNPNQFADFLSELDFNLLLFSCMDECLIKKGTFNSMASLAFELSVLRDGNCFIPFVLDTQIVICLCNGAMKDPKESKLYVQNQLSAILEMLSTLYNGLCEQEYQISPKT